MTMKPMKNDMKKSLGRFILGWIMVMVGSGGVALGQEGLKNYNIPGGQCPGVKYIYTFKVTGAGLFVLKS